MFNEVGPRQIALGNYVEEWQEAIDYANGVDTTNIDDFQVLVDLNIYAHNARTWLADSLATDPDGDSGNLLREFVFAPTSPLLLFFNRNNTALPLFEKILNVSYTERMNEITIPTLLIWGKYDFVVPPELAHTAEPRMGGPVTKVILPASAHPAMNEEAVAYVNAVVDFVEQYR